MRERDVTQPVRIGDCTFEVGQFYRRAMIHDRLGGSRQSGICPLRQFGAILLFTGETGERHGYGYDGWSADGLFHYTGEGQRGDMIWLRGNRAVRDHVENGKRLLLFGKAPRGQANPGEVKFMGEMECVDTITHERDSAGTGRTTFVFVLKPVSAHQSIGS